MKWHIKTQNGDVIGILELAHDLVVEPEQPQEPPAPPAPPEMVEHKTMTEKAGSFTYEQFVDKGWTDNALVANGLMSIQLEPVNREAPAETPQAPQPPAAQVAPDVQAADLGPDWEPERQAAPAAPKAPEPPATAAPAAPKAPEPPAPKAPEPPAPAAPKPPEQQTAPAAPKPPASSTDMVVPEKCSVCESEVPHIPGREFMIRNVSYEKLMDAKQNLFDGRIHGIKADNTPATRKDGTFTKKRGVESDMYGRLIVEQDEAWRQMSGASQATNGDQSQASAPPAPPAPPGTNGAAPPAPPAPPGAAPAPPAGQASGGTAPPVPDNIADLEKELQNWGDEM